MSYTWVAVAAAAAMGLGVAAQRTMSRPMPTYVKSLAVGFQSERTLDQNNIDKAIVFAMAAKNSGTFVGAAYWPSLAASAGVPSGVAAAGFPSNWTASWSGSALTVCLIGASNAAVSAITTNMSGVTAKNSGC